MAIRFPATLPRKEGIYTYEQATEILNRALTTLFWTSPNLNPEYGKMEPPAEQKRDGLLAYADGTNWNPGGTGKGLYRWNATTSAWVLVG